jgi:P27 family predicted phage terminase small subunit
MAKQRQTAVVRELHGARPGRQRRIPARDTDGQAPPRPDWLNAQQRELWDWLVPLLDERRVLDELAAIPLADLVVALSIRDNAAAMLAAEGITAEGRREGEPVKHPAFVTWRGAVEVARRAARDLGIVAPASTPVAPDPAWQDPARLLSPQRPPR